MLGGLLKKKMSLDETVEYVVLQLIEDLNRDWESIVLEVEKLGIVFSEEEYREFQLNYLAAVIASEVLVVNNITPKYLSKVISEVNMTLTKVASEDLIELYIEYSNAMLGDIKNGRFPFEMTTIRVFENLHYEGKSESQFLFFSLTFQTLLAQKKTYWKMLNEKFKIVAR